MPAYHKAIMVDLLCASAINTKVLKKKEKQMGCMVSLQCYRTGERKELNHKAMD
jgi:hypothetical protein